MEVNDNVTEGQDNVNQGNENTNVSNEKNSEEKPFITVNIKGVDVPFTESQVRADLGKGRLYDSAKQEASKYKKVYKRANALGLNDEIFQAIEDAKSGNINAREYVLNTLFPNQEEDEAVYRPIVQEQLPLYLEEAKDRNDGSYEKFTSAIEGEAKYVYNDIKSLNIDESQKNVYMKAFMEDIVSGSFNEIMPLAYAINSQSGLSFLESYVQAGRKLEAKQAMQQDNSNQQQDNQNARGYSRQNSIDNAPDFSGLSGEERAKLVAKRKAELKRKFG